MGTPTLPRGIKFEIGDVGYVCTFNSTGGFRVVSLTGAEVGGGQVVFDGKGWRVSEPMSTGITRPIARRIEEWLAQPGHHHPPGRP